jgi:hypothetical protein
MVSGGRRRAGGTPSGRRPRLSSREREVRKRAAQRRRERIVERFDGCLEALPRRQRTTLILRYGIGPVRARSGKQAARLLDLSRRKVGLLERRGLRTLADAGRRTSCERTAVSPTSFVAVYDLLSATSVAATERFSPAVAAGVMLARAAAVALEQGGGAVAGARESGGDPKRASSEQDEVTEEPPSSAGPSLGDPFGSGNSDDAMVILMLAIVLACLASAVREVRRAVR